MLLYSGILQKSPCYNHDKFTNINLFPNASMYSSASLAYGINQSYQKTFHWYGSVMDITAISNNLMYINNSGIPSFMVWYG